MKARSLRGWTVLVTAVAIPMAGCVSVPGYEEARERAVITAGRLEEPVRSTASEPLHDDLTRIIGEAARHNAALRAAFARWRAALERVPQATALPDPMLTFGHFIESVETRVGPQRNRFEVMQKFPWPGKLDLRGRMALAAAAAAEQELEVERLRVIYDVTRTYDEFVFLERAIHITEQNQKLLANVENVAQSLLKAGKAPQQHVVAAQVELGRLADRLRTLTDRRRAITAKLNSLMNRPVDAPLTPPSRLSAAALAGDDAALREGLRRANPSLLALDKRIEQAETAIELARKNYWPDVSVGLTWIEVGDAVMSGVADSGDDALMVGVSVNLPIWRRKLRAGVREAEAARSAALSMRREMENRLAARLEDVLYRFRDADRQVKLYTDSLIPKAEQAYRTAQTGYSAGTVTFQNLIDSERLLLTFQLARERALADRAQRLAEVLMLAPPAPDTQMEDTP